MDGLPIGGDPRMKATIDATAARLTDNAAWAIAQAQQHPTPRHQPGTPGPRADP